MTSHSEIIQNNIRKLCDWTICSPRLLDRCVEEGILTLDDCNQIEDNNDQYTRNRAFYNFVRKVEPHKLMILIDLMGEKETKESSDVLEILRTGGSPSELNHVVQRFEKVSLNSTQTVTGPQRPPQARQPPPTAVIAVLHSRPQLSVIEQLVANESLLKAAQHDQLQNVKMLLAKGADINCTEGKKNWTPLHIAAINNNVATVKFLVENGANLNAKDVNGKTPFTLAVGEFNYVNLTPLLAPKGVGTSVNDPVGRNNETTLHIAAKNGEFDMVKSLVVQGANIHLITKFGETPFHLAVQKGHISIAQYLLEIGSDPFRLVKDEPFRGVESPKYKTVIHLAMYAPLRTKEESVKWLLEYARAQCRNEPSKFLDWLNVRDGADQTPIMVALYQCSNNIGSPSELAPYIQIFKLLVDYGSNLNVKFTTEGINGWDLRKYAKRYRLDELNQYLKQAEKAKSGK